jgi:hypothetical protein
MQRFFFDRRDEDQIVPDFEGRELPDIEAVKTTAAKTLAKLAIDVLPGVDRHCLAVDVRDARDRKVLTTELTFEVRILAD